MPDVCNKDLPVGVEKLVVFKVGAHVGVGALRNCAAEQEASGPSAQGDFFTGFSSKAVWRMQAACMPDLTS